VELISEGLAVGIDSRQLGLGALDDALHHLQHQPRRTVSLMAAPPICLCLKAHIDVARGAVVGERGGRALDEHEAEAPDVRLVAVDS